MRYGSYFHFICLICGLLYGMQHNPQPPNPNGKNDCNNVEMILVPVGIQTMFGFLQVFFYSLQCRAINVPRLTSFLFLCYNHLENGE